MSIERKVKVVRDKKGRMIGLTYFNQEKGVDKSLDSGGVKEGSTDRMIEDGLVMDKDGSWREWVEGEDAKVDGLFFEGENLVDPQVEGEGNED